MISHSEYFILPIVTTILSLSLSKGFLYTMTKILLAVDPELLSPFQSVFLIPVGPSKMDAYSHTIGELENVENYFKIRKHTTWVKETNYKTENIIVKSV